MRSVRTVEYIVGNVTSLVDLCDMMRYDGFRFQDTGDLRSLARHDAGIVDQEFEPQQVRLLKDQPLNWMPTVDRWHSFQMQITTNDSWSRCPEIV